jgi:putative ABC transport system permease protein
MALSSSSTMRRVSLRNLAAHKIRLALTVLSVVLGTAFVAGSFVFTDTLGHTFNGIFSDVAKGVDVQVRGKEDGSSGVPLSDIDTIKAVPGVRAVEPQVGNDIVLLGSNGKKVQGGGARASDSLTPRRPSTSASRSTSPRGMRPPEPARSA